MIKVGDRIRIYNIDGYKTGIVLGVSNDFIDDSNNIKLKDRLVVALNDGINTFCHVKQCRKLISKKHKSEKEYSNLLRGINND